MAEPAVLSSIWMPSISERDRGMVKVRIVDTRCSRLQAELEADLDLAIDTPPRDNRAPTRVRMGSDLKQKSCTCFTRPSTIILQVRLVHAFDTLRFKRRADPQHLQQDSTAPE